MQPIALITATAKLGIAIMITHAAIAGAADIKVLSSNGMHSVLHDVVPEFERASGHRLSIVYDTANAIHNRIKSGETADLVILTAPVIDELTKQGRVVAGGNRDLASSGVGIAVRAGAPKPDISTVEALKRALLNAKSIAYTGTGASGIYFAGVIERLGIAAQVKAKARIPAGGLVGELVARGEAEMAVQQIPELMSVPGIDLVGPLPPELQNITVLRAGIIADAAPAAQALLEFLYTPGVARVIKAKGMQPG